MNSFVSDRTTIPQAILSTIAYFDTFSYPLTVHELTKWLLADPALGRPTYTDIRAALDQPPLTGMVTLTDGFCILAGREGTIDERQRRALWAERKYLRALRVIRWLSAMPFVRMIAVCNTLALSHSRNDSDIDLFLLASPGRVWIARLWTTTLLKLAGIRPSKRRTRDTVCLSFYCDTSDAMNLADLQWGGGPDLYLAYWIDTLVPVYDPHGLADRFREANSWIGGIIPNAYGVEPIALRRVEDGFLPWLVRGVIELFHIGWLGDGLVRLARRIQLRILPIELKSLMNRDSRVVLSDRRLKFHANDRRAQMLGRWRARRTDLFAALR